MLYPIRIQASSKDNSIRIIDTMLIDPLCLPVPPSSCVPSIDQLANNNINIQKRIISENAKYFATALLSDMEVHSVTKVNKSARVKLMGSSGLQQEVKRQITEQLEAIVILEQDRKQKEKIHYRDVAKRRRMDMEVSSRNKKEGVEKESAKYEYGDADIGEGGKGSEVAKLKKENQDSDAHKSTNETFAEDENNSYLLPINIRIKEDGICIVDEFEIDPYHHLSNPILLATAMVNDLNLPLKFINSIAISIAEQMCGLDVPWNINGLKVSVKKNENATKNTPMTAAALQAAINSTNIPKGVQVKNEIPSAWRTTEKEEEVAMANYVKIAKPDYHTMCR